MSTERIDIYGGKATIKQNKFGVWQFRMWVSNEKRYYEKSLRTKRRAEAIDKAEEMYFDLQNELKDGRKLFSVSIADAVAIYLEHRKIDVRTKEIVEGRWVTIRAHLNHFIEYVGENEKAANLGINTLVKFEWKGKETNYSLAKQVGIEVEQRNTEEEWDVAYKRRVVSVAVSRKKKVAVEAIESVVSGVFPC